MMGVAKKYQTMHITKKASNLPMSRLLSKSLNMLSFDPNIVYIVPRVNFMSLNKSDIEKIAHLARLQIEEIDIPLYANNLSNILRLVEQMNAVNTTGVEIMAHPLDAAQRLRTDVVTEIDQRKLFQSIAPQVEAGLYLVPKVIE